MAEIYYGKNYIRQVLGRDVSMDTTNVRTIVEEVASEKIEEVVNNAPEELDTLGEVADAIRTNSDSISDLTSGLDRIEIRLANVENDDVDWETMGNFDIQGIVDSIFE